MTALAAPIGASLLAFLDRASSFCRCEGDDSYCPHCCPPPSDDDIDDYLNVQRIKGAAGKCAGCGDTFDRHVQAFAVDEVEGLRCEPCALEVAR